MFAFASLFGRTKKQPPRLGQRLGIERLEDRLAPVADIGLVSAERFDGPGFVRGARVAVDPLGNSYHSGSFSGTVDFDPGGGVLELTSTGTSDGFVVKLDPWSRLVFAKRIGSGPTDIEVDASGEIIVTGVFGGTVDFDPGPGVFELTSQEGLFSDAFVAKLDVSGNLVFAEKFGGPGTEFFESAAVDALGNIWLTGGFAQTVDFDPGAGDFSLTSAGALDAFVMKLSPAGGLLFAYRFGSSNDDSGTGVAVDASGNVHTTGYFEGTIDVDPGAGVSNLTNTPGSFLAVDTFVVKLDSAGGFLFGRQLGGPGYDRPWGIALAGSGNVLLTGDFSGTADFDPGPGTLPLTANAPGTFVVKLDSAGDLLFAKQFDSTEFVGGRAIATGDSGNVFVTGYFKGTTDFDPGLGAFSLTSAGDFDIFVVELDASGELLYATGFGGPGFDIGQNIVVDPSDAVVVTGAFSGTVDFDPGSALANLSSAPNSFTVFLVKLGTMTQERAVKRLYQELLGRTPPPEQQADVDYWLGVLRTQDFAAVVRGFIDSAEYRTRIIQDLYQRFLGRTPDAPGLAHWLGVFAGEGGTLDVTRGIVHSDEYFLRHGNADALFAHLYLNTLGRPIDPAGQAMIREALAGGASIASVADVVLYSREHYNRLVQQIYQTHLGRAAEAGGEEGWVSFLTRGVQIDDVMIAILSDEGGEFFVRLNS